MKNLFNKQSVITVLTLVILVIFAVSSYGQTKNDEFVDVDCSHFCQKVAFSVLDAQTGLFVQPDSLEIYSEEDDRLIGFLSKKDFTMGDPTVITFSEGGYYIDIYAQDYHFYGSASNAFTISPEFSMGEYDLRTILLKPQNMSLSNLGDESFLIAEPGYMKSMGRITDLFGRPVKDAEITVSSVDFGNNLYSTFSDKDGVYYIKFPKTHDGMPYVKYDITFSKDGYELVTQNRPINETEVQVYFSPRLIPQDLDYKNYTEKRIRIKNDVDFSFGSRNLTKSFLPDYCEQDYIRVAMDCSAQDTDNDGAYDCCISCSCTGVIDVPMDQYVQSVLPAEWSAAWIDFGSDDAGIDAYYAAAVAVKCFGHYKINHPAHSTYDIGNSTCNQVLELQSIVIGSDAYEAFEGTFNWFVKKQGPGEIASCEFSAEVNDFLPSGYPSGCADGYTAYDETCGDGYFMLSQDADDACYPLFGMVDFVSLGKYRDGHNRGMSQRGSARWALGYDIAGCGGEDGFFENQVMNTDLILPSTHENFTYCTKNWQEIIAWYYPYWVLENCTTSEVINLEQLHISCDIATCEDENEPNDLNQDAQQLSVGVVYEMCIGEGETDDWFKFPIQGIGELLVELNNPSHPSLSFELVSDGIVFALDEASTIENRALSACNQYGSCGNGDVFLHVYSQTAPFDYDRTYTINSSFTEGSVCDHNFPGPGDFLLLPEQEVVASDTLVCASQAVTLSATDGNVNYTWYSGPDGSGNIIQDGVDNDIVVYPNQTATYSVFVLPTCDSGSGMFLNITITVDDCINLINDNPCNAQVLTVGSSCQFTTGTNLGATASSVADPGTCALSSTSSDPSGGYSGGDIWYEVTVPNSGVLIFQSEIQSAVTDLVFVAYEGQNCEDLVEIGCNDDQGIGSWYMPYLELTNLTPGNHVLLRVFEFGNNTFGEFGVCVTTSNPGQEDCDDFSVQIQALQNPITTGGSTLVYANFFGGSGQYEQYDIAWSGPDIDFIDPYTGSAIEVSPLNSSVYTCSVTDPVSGCTTSSNYYLSVQDFGGYSPNLVAHGLHVPHCPILGEYYGFFGSVYNFGSGYASSFSYKIVLSENSTYDGDDLIIFEDDCDGLNSGEGCSFNFDYFFSEEFDTSFDNVLLVVDWDNDVSESSEGDNLLQKDISYCSLSDISVEIEVNNSTLEFPVTGCVSASSGGPVLGPSGFVGNLQPLTLEPNEFTVSFEFENDGTEDCPEFDYIIVLSNDQFFDASDSVLYESTYYNLSENETVFISQTIGLSSDVDVVDVYYVIIVADPDNFYSSDNDFNNQVSLLLPLCSNPDYGVSIEDVYFNGGCLNGGEFLVPTFKFWNQGELSSTPLEFKAYLSSDNFLDGTDQLIDIDYYNDVLNLQDTIEYSWLINLDESIVFSSSEMHLFIQIGQAGSVFEDNLFNNVDYQIIQTCNSTSLIDLELANLELVSSSSCLSQGESFSIEYEYWNNGSSNVGQHDRIVVFSTDTILDPTDVVLAQHSISQLSGYGSGWVSLNFSVPGSLSEEYIYILVCVDSNEQISESDELNNCVFVPFTICGFVDYQVSLNDVTMNQDPYNLPVGPGCIHPMFFSNFNFTLDLTNNGEFSDIPFEILFVASSDEVYDEFEDVVLWDYNYGGPDIQVGQVTEAEYSIFLSDLYSEPLFLENNSLNILILINSDGALYEPNMSNNMIVYNVPICDIVYGCMDYAYCEANSYVIVQEEGACQTLKGCNIPEACNYDPTAGCYLLFSCTFPQNGYDCEGDCMSDTDGDGICDEFEIVGCQDSEACNYDSDATDPGDCLYLDCLDVCGGSATQGCTDILAANYQSEADCDDGSCLYGVWGCVDMSACNYDEVATLDDGSCIYPDIYDCEGDCISDTDGDGICDELELDVDVQFSDVSWLCFLGDNQIFSFDLVNPGLDTCPNFSFTLHYSTDQFLEIEDSLIFTGVYENLQSQDTDLILLTLSLSSNVDWDNDYLILTLDSGNTVNETNEGNNQISVLLSTCLNYGCTDPDSDNYDPDATIPDGTCVGCTGDVNLDGVVNSSDLSALLAVFGCNDCIDSPADLNNDGIVSSADLSLLLSSYGDNCNEE